MDETLALPTDEAVMIALRTQQVLAEETGVTNVVDPLGGSYFVESLTNRIEKDALDYIRRIDEMGGMIKAVEKGFPQAEIANSAYHFQKQLEKKEKIMVGVNRYQSEEKKRQIETLYIDREVERSQIQRLAEMRRQRKSHPFEDSLRKLKDDAQAGKNLMPAIIDCVKAQASLQEVCDLLRTVYGEYRETGHF